ncbi:hypothetical protein EBB79_08330 [Parasedimentitalea marina]|uniref:Uncharacterized protein n=1 Tax=Parasedimentitalea marina TaxID=2483033 RepID=A0A3T0N1M6_9RHOB|nr:hypothetical protein [Parasedimentitalea marina]AZV77901.1 hypothetical protein EBB79_08330 [Parasedimentitalea marina]
MNSYQEEQKIARRGAIVGYLHQVNGQPANADILLAVAKGCGIPSYYNEIIAAVSWLEEKGLVQTGGDGDVIIAEITKRGKRLARNEIVDEGVRLPDGGQ